jgi:hypothetical protein
LALASVQPDRIPLGFQTSVMNRVVDPGNGAAVNNAKIYVDGHDGAESRRAFEIPGKTAIRRIIRSRKVQRPSQVLERAATCGGR